MLAKNHKVKKDLTELQEHRGLNTKRPQNVFFLGPTKPLPSHDTVLVKSRENDR
jgi:hypothetical protein